MEWPGHFDPIPCGDPSRYLTALYGYHCPSGRQPLHAIIAPGVERIELVTDGRGTCVIEGIERECLPGILLWQVAGDQTIARAGPQGYRCLVAAFQVPRSAPRPAPRLVRIGSVAEARTLARELLAAARDPAADRSALAALAWGRLIHLARRPATTSALPPPLQRVLSLVDQRFTEALATADLCAAAGWSASTLHDRCQAMLGRTPHQLVVERRMRAACELLRGSDLPVAEIGRRCGFTAAAHFVRLFRSIHGSPPAAWRRESSAEPTWSAPPLVSADPG